MASKTQLPSLQPLAPFMRLRSVAAFLGVSRATVYRLVRSGRLPRPLQISPGVKVYATEDVLALVQKQEGARG